MIHAQTFEVYTAEAKSDQDVVEVHRLLMMMARESAYAPVNVTKTLSVIRDTMNEGIVLMAYTEQGELVGTMGIAEVDFWYSDETFLADRWMYVLPEYRGSEAGTALLSAARSIADEMKKLLIVTTNNPRRRRGGHSAVEKAASLLRYVPSGSVLAFRSEEAKADVLWQQ